MTNKNIEKIYELAIGQHEKLEDEIEVLESLRAQSFDQIELIEKELEK